MGLLDLLVSAIQIAIPQPCFDKYTQNYDFFDGPCFKIVLSKCLGLAIILGSVLVKVPQIVKMMRAQSSAGISILSNTLELAAITSSFAYGYGKGFPFSAYGEGLFLVLQTLTIAYLTVFNKGATNTRVLADSQIRGTTNHDLVHGLANHAYGEGLFLALQTLTIAYLTLFYSLKKTQALTYTAIYTVILAFLMSPLVPMGLLQALQACVMPNLVFARAIQIIANYKNASTGQLSAVTVFLLYIGALSRIFTSLQETGDMLLVITYVVSSSCSGIILFQIWYYRNSADKVGAASSSRAKVE